LGNILMLRPRSEFDPRHQIRKIYGGPISTDMFRVFREEFHIPILIEGYGMSEIPATCSNPFDGPQKVGSVGRPCRHPSHPGPFTEVRIIDEAGTPLPAGEIGELVVRTPTIFQGYLNDPQQTASAFRDGWFLTGDLAQMDEDGYVFFVGRKKDIIRRRGENISGAELDRILAERPDITEVATIGVPAELGDEELLAVLVANPSYPKPTYEEILDWSQKRLAAIKVPRFFLFVDELPHTPTHRVAKQILKRDVSLLGRAFDAEAVGTRAQA
jgi:carnitine-CoA ligase